MLRVLIKPTTFEILPKQTHQNPYIDTHHKVSKHAANQQHTNLIKELTLPIVFSLNKPEVQLPDIVYIASAGLSLPRLPTPCVVLPNMKYSQRKAELPYIKSILSDLKIPYIDYPGKEPFEGQAEFKWFDGGRKAICGYGYRSTKQTYVELNKFFKKVYGDKAPELLVVPIVSPNYYHLDLAILEYDNTKCIVQKHAFSDATLNKIKTFLGKDNVTVIDSPDNFCLNAVIDGKKLITHTLTDPSLKPELEKLTGLTVKQLSMSEFEKSGGSVRCVTFDIYV